MVSENATGPATEAKRLGFRTDPYATAQLLELTRHSELEGDPAFRLHVSLALAQHLGSQRRSEVVRALIGLFQQDQTEKQPLSPREERVRATAALILAEDGHPEGLRVLVSHAALSDASDSRRLARAALHVHPPSAESLTSLEPLVSREVLRRLSADFTRQRQQADEGLQAERDLSPLSLIRTGGSGNLSQLLAQVLQTRTELPKAFHRPKAWNEAFARNAVTTLRVLSVLAKLRLPKLGRYALSRARASLAAKDANLRSAAAWTIAVLAPQDTWELVASRDEVIVAAALRQLHEEVACNAMRARLAAPLFLTKTSVLGLLAERCALSHEHISTSALWELAETSLLPAVTQLASRLAHPPVLRAPDVAQVERWLHSANGATRAAAAHGLAASTEGSAVGLLQSAYLNEDDPNVRRGIVRALSRVAGPKDRILRTAALFDPDRSCRLLALDPKSTAEAGFWMVEKSLGKTHAVSHFGRQYSGTSAPDGFFAIIGEEFALPAVPLESEAF